MQGRGRDLVAVLLAVLVLAGSALVLGTRAAATGLATGVGVEVGVGDQSVWPNGGDLGGPSGYMRFSFRNVGTEPLVGRTTVVAEIGSGPMRFTHAAFFPAGGPVGGDTLTSVGPEISPGGTRLVLYLDGTNAPGVTREVRVYFTGNQFLRPSSSRITFTHPGDLHPANDSVSYGPTPPPPPTTTTTSP